MPFQVSPGVSVVETDLTTIVPTISTTAAGFVGFFGWGPANEIRTISSENELRQVYGDPDDDNFSYWFSAGNFLRYGSNLQVVRAVEGSGRNSGSLFSSDGSGGVSGAFPLSEKLTSSTSSINGTGYGTFMAKYPGPIGNNIGVAAWDGMGNSGQTFTDWGFDQYFREAPDTTARAQERTGITTGFCDEVHVIVYDATGYFTGTKNEPLEIFEGLSKATDAKKDDGTSNYYRTVINNSSEYILATKASNTGISTEGTAEEKTIQEYYNGVATASVPSIMDGLTAGFGFAGGSAGLETSEIVTQYNDLFANSETQDVSLLISGPADNTLRNTIVDIAETRKDCVAFVSPDLNDVTGIAESLKADAVISARNDVTTKSSYAVMDSGWKYQYDPYNDKFRYIPLNPDVAGLCAKTDQIAEPWFSPAGFNRGAIRNVIKLAYSPDKTDRDKLYVKGVNPVVSFTGEGIVLFGDKTMQAKPSAFDRINVRRLFNVLEKSISTAAKFSLFEFNDEFTRAAFRNLVEPFLRDVQARRGIFDFKVVCDETNNTPLIIDKNEFRADIYVKPARSINFITLNFVASPTGVDFDEIGA